MPVNVAPTVRHRAAARVAPVRLRRLRPPTKARAESGIAGQVAGDARPGPALARSVAGRGRWITSSAGSCQTPPAPTAPENVQNHRLPVPKPMKSTTASARPNTKNNEQRHLLHSKSTAFPSSLAWAVRPLAHADNGNASPAAAVAFAGCFRANDRAARQRSAPEGVVFLPRSSPIQQRALAARRAPCRADGNDEAARQGIALVPPGAPLFHFPCCRQWQLAPIPKTA
jgi:hypothetical protein